MKRFYAGLMVLVLCACSLLQLASQNPLIWFSATLCAGVICMLCAWGIWYRKLAFIALLFNAVALGWGWKGSVWLFTSTSLWDPVEFFSRQSPYLAMRHSLILWVMLIALIGILIQPRHKSKSSSAPEQTSEAH